MRWLKHVGVTEKTYFSCHEDHSCVYKLRITEQKVSMKDNDSNFIYTES